MSDDSSLKLGFQVDNASAIPDAVNQAAASVDAASRKMAQAFLNNLPPAISSIAETVHTRFAQINDEVDHTNAVVSLMANNVPKNLARDIVDAWQGYGPVIQEVQDGTEKAGMSFRNASYTVYGLAQEMDTHLPRATSTWLSQMKGIGPFLSAAFPVIGVLGLIEAMDQVPKAFDKMIGAVTGWDEAAQKAYENEIRLNKEFLSVNQQAAVEETKLHFGKVAGDEEEQKQLEAQIKLLNERRDITQEEIAARKFNSTVSSETPELLKPVTTQTNKELDDILKQTKEDAGKAALELDKLNKLTIPKDQREEQEKFLQSLDQIGTKTEENARKAQEVADRQQQAYNRMIDSEAKLAETIADIHDQQEKKMVADQVKGITEQIENERKLAKYHQEIMEEQALAQEKEIEAGVKKNEEVAKRTADELIRLANERNSRELQTDQAGLNERLRVHQISLKQYDQQERAAIDAWYQYEKRIIQESGDLEVVKNARIAALDAQRLEKEKQVDNKILQEEQKTLNKIDQLFNTSIEKWISGQEKFSKAMAQTWQKIEESIVSSLLKTAEQMVANAILQKTLGKQNIESDAAQAAAHVYKDVLASAFGAALGPFAIPVAAGAAATAFAAVSAFGSFKEGGVVPDDMFAQVHKNEMVLPADLSSAVQRMAGGGGRGGGGNAVHVHYQNNGSASSAMQRQDIVKAVKMGMRNGSLRPLGR